MRTTVARRIFSPWIGWALTTGLNMVFLTRNRRKNTKNLIGIWITRLTQEIRVYKAEQPDLAPQKGLYVNERYQVLKRKESQALLSDEGSHIFAQVKLMWNLSLGR